MRLVQTRPIFGDLVFSLFFYPVLCINLPFKKNWLIASGIDFSQVFQSLAVNLTCTAYVMEEGKAGADAQKRRADAAGDTLVCVRACCECVRARVRACVSKSANRERSFAAGQNFFGWKVFCTDCWRFSLPSHPPPLSRACDPCLGGRKERKERVTHIYLHGQARLKSLGTNFLRLQIHRYRHARYRYGMLNANSMPEDSLADIFKKSHVGILELADKLLCQISLFFFTLFDNLRYSMRIQSIAQS